MTTSPNATTSRAVLVLIAALLAVLAVVPVLVVDDLPDRLATRWDAGGTPTSSSSAGLLLAVVAVAVGLSAAALVWVAVSRRPRAAQQAPLIAGTAAVLGAVLALPVAMILAANSGSDDWRQVGGPAGWQIAVVVGGSLALGVLAAWAASSFPVVDDRPEPTPPLAAPAGAQVAWSRRLSVVWAMAASLAAVAAGAVTAAMGEVGVGLLVSVVGAATSVLSRIQVFADRRGVTVTYGWWTWPRTRIPLDRIESAAAIEVLPSEWGGWGYRGSVRLFRQAAVVLRKGEGLRVDLTDGRRFVVTIGDAATAAAVLNRELVRVGRS